MNPVFLRLTNLEIYAVRPFALVLIVDQLADSLGNLEPFKVSILGDSQFPVGIGIQ